MIRRIGAFLLLGLSALLLPAPAEVRAQKQEPWGTVKGRFVWGGKDIPAREVHTVNQDKAHCLANGPLLDEKIIVNPKNKGVKNVLVWLRPAADQALKIHPDLQKNKEPEVVIDQPMCAFIPHVVGV